MVMDDRTNQKGPEGPFWLELLRSGSALAAAHGAKAGQADTEQGKRRRFGHCGQIDVGVGPNCKRLINASYAVEAVRVVKEPDRLKIRPLVWPKLQRGRGIIAIRCRDEADHIR